MSARSSIGGLLDTASYAALAQLHRPNDQEQIAGEIRRLAATGLKPRDVAITMRVDVTAVLAALGEPAASHEPISPLATALPSGR